MVNFSPMFVNVFAFKVNTMERASSFSFGPLQQLDLFISTKRNQGVESMGDLSPLFMPITNILDTDLIDSNSVKNSVV